MKRGKLIVLAVVAVVAATALFFGFRNRGNKTEELNTVEISAINQEIFATGKVQPTEELRLSFQTTGLIAQIYAKEGEKVEKGQLLAELDKQELESRLKEAQAGLSVQKSSLASLEVQLQNAKAALLTRTRDSYTKIEEAIFTKAEPFFTSGTFGLSVQESSVNHTFNTPDLELSLHLNSERKDLIKLIPQWGKTVLKDNLSEEADLARERLERVLDFLDDLARAASHFSTEKTTVASVIEAHRSDVSSAQSSISSAIVNLDSALQDFLLAQSNVSGAGVEQAKAQIETLQVQLSQTRILAPWSGTILTKQATAGEVVQTGAAVFTFYPDDPLRIEAEIYEGDIGAVSVGQKARLDFVAYPDQTFEGEVVEIDPAPVLIDGVVHYLATLQIIEGPPNILPSMSVDVRFSIE